MKTSITKIFTLAFVLSIIGCGSNTSTPTQAFSNFNPEIVNSTDAFQFQITGAENVTTTVSYLWENTGTQATVNHSTATDSGTAVITVLSADSSQVYSSGLVASTTEPTSVGTAGFWIIRLTFDHYYGTANFRLEKL